MKKLLFILGIIILAGGIFGGGLWVGTLHDIFNADLAIAGLGDDISKAATTLVVLRDLEAGKIDEAKAFLNLQLDGTIIGMYFILPYCPDGDSAHAAQTLLAGIAEHRSKYPIKSDEEIDRKVQDILNKSRKQNQ